MKKLLSALVITLALCTSIAIACEGICNCGCQEGKKCICNKDNKIGVTSCICPNCGTEVACSGKGRCFCPSCDKIFKCTCNKKANKFKLFFTK